MTQYDALARLVHAVDDLDWPGVRACLANSVDLDYSELSGSRAGPTAVDDVVGQWQALLPGFVATQHLLGPIVVRTGSTGPVTRAHVRAWHHLPDLEPWVVAGHYEASLDDDGRIDALTLRVFHVQGPQDATERATARAASDPRA